MKDVLAGVDLGGTTITVAFSDMDGHLLFDECVATEAHNGPDNVIQRIGKLLKELALSKSSNIKAVGVGAPGLIDVENGVTKFLPNLPGQWRDVPLAAKLTEFVRCPVKVVNDARAATLGELKFGHGKVFSNATLAFFTLGTGVGGGVAVDGKLRLGTLGAAGELGHQTIVQNGLKCGCGNRGCLETLASGPAIAAEGIRLMKSGLAPNLYEKLGGNADRVSVAEMMAVYENDTAIQDAILAAANYIGIAAANVVAILHPDLIVFGGGVAEIGKPLIDTVSQVIVDRVGMFPADNVQVKKSMLGVKAGAMGAIGLAMNTIGHVAI